MSLKRELEDDFSERVVKAAKHEEETIKKHSLDSDEEDSDEERKKHYEILDDDDIEGQEEGVSGQDGEVKITPFNMKEELEEGHFDTEGNFHWDKSSEIKDNWLDNIDWMQIKDQNPNQKKLNEDLDASLDSDTSSPFDQVAVYKQILELLKPGETVAKALRRLGGNKSLSASERLKRKKAGLSLEVNNDSQKVTELTELANRLLTSTGNMNVYQESYEHIKDIVESKPGTSRMKYDDAVDMFADDFDEREKERIEKKTEQGDEDGFKKPQNVNPVAGEAQSGVMEGGKVLMWEYKLDKDSSNIQGPHTTEQMQKYVEEGFFKSEVWIRKVGQDGPFYSSKRIDFELYL